LVAASVALLALAFAQTLGAWAAPDPRVVDPTAVDKNRNRISDVLERKAATHAMATLRVGGARMADLIICLDHAPGAGDKAAIQSLGGDALRAWKDLVYAIHARLPTAAGKETQALQQLTRRIPGAVLIEENARSRALLYMSTRQSGARAAWTAGYCGDANTTIAVMDTGITGSHADFPAGKVVAWNDLIGPDSSNPQPGFYATPTDVGEHGTHVSGIAAGEGLGAGMATGTGTLYVSDDSFFAPYANNSWVAHFPVDTRGYASNASIVGRLKWIDNLGGSYSVSLNLGNSAGVPLASNTTGNGGAQPLTTTYATLAPGIFSYRYQEWPTCSVANNNVSPNWALVGTPMTAIGDGFRLMCGVAWGCKLAGIKVLDDTGSGSAVAFLDGLDWIVTNKTTFNIKVVNMSMGFDSVIGSIDTAVNNAAGAGLVMVAAAGNGRGGPAQYVYSPASASRCIAVAATSHTDRVTSYSSYGNAGSKKPDVSAAGGTDLSGDERLIMAPDTGDAELNYDPSTGIETSYPAAWVESDYTGMMGTSVASPHVAGAAGLVISALGAWMWTQSEALHVKALIGMTCTETNRTAEATPNPVLNRAANLDGSGPGKDHSEGFGRVNMNAAIAAATLSYTVGAPASATLGSTPNDEKCWARAVSLTPDTAYQFDLSVPGSADFDLYLYSSTWTNDGSASNGSVGDPVIAASSCSATAGQAEKINFSCCASGTYYIVVKWVSGSGSFSLTSQSYVFADVAPGAFAQAAIEAMKANGITGGCALNGACADSYCPNDSVTRGQMAVFMCRAAGLTWFDPGTATFTDVPRGSDGIFTAPIVSNGCDADGTFQFYGWVERLADAASWGGAAPTGGCALSPPRYCPDTAVTRAQMATFLSRAKSKTWYDPGSATFADVPRGTDGVFTPPIVTNGCDVDGTHQFYGWVERLADPASWAGNPPTTGCAAGPPRTFCPNDPCTRAQMAIFLCRAFGIPF
jgi:subtilisin family serine protease